MGGTWWWKLLFLCPAVYSSPLGRQLSAASDLAALNACFQAWGSPSSALTGGWGGAGPVCSEQNQSAWTGVTCAGGEVVALHLQSRRLAGSIPSSLGGLTGLTYLDLSYNALISGNIPSSLGGLTGLTYLDLRANALTGSLPSSLGGLTGLTYLNLYGNALSGSIPSSIGALTGLTGLYLYGNALSGSIPSSIGALTGLTGLYLWYNHFSGTIPSSLGGLTGLTAFQLSGNSLVGSIPPELGALKGLMILHFNSNSLSASIPSFLGALTRLTQLALDRNALSGSIPPSLGALSRLTSLGLSSNRLTGSIPSSLGALTGLISIDLSSNRLAGSIPASLGALTRLTSLVLSINSLSGSIPSSLGALTGLTSLALDGNSLSGSIPSSLECLTGLTSLALQTNALSGSLSKNLGLLTALRTLDLESNRLEGSLPSELGQLTCLTELYLNDNLFSSLIPSSMGNLHALTELYLFFNAFSGSLPSSFCRLFNNIKLHIEITDITSYPACMSTFKFLTHDAAAKPYTAAPSPFPSSAPTMYPTSSTTLVPAQWRFASFQVSQTFVCVGAAALCSSAALFKPVVQAANTRLWARYADRETQWLTEKTIDAAAVLSFNDVSSVVGGFLVSYFYTFRPIDLKMSSMEAVRLSFQRAVASLNLTAYNAELMQVLQASSSSNPLSALTAPLKCTKIDVGAATLANGVPTAFPTTTPVAVFVLSAQIALMAAGAVAVALSIYVWFLRSGLQRHQHQQGETENGERIVAFRPNEFALPIVITVMAAASNVYQIKTYFQDGSPSTAALAAVMMASRVAVALYSCALLYLTLTRGSYSKHLAATLLHKTTLWVAVAALALLDPTHLRFFPWRHSEFAERSRGFPTLRFFKLALGCTAANALLQLSVSAARGLSFSSVASLVLSLLLFCSTVFTIVVKLTAEKIHKHDLTLLAEPGDLESMGREIASLRTDNASLRVENESLRRKTESDGGIALVTLSLPQPKRPAVHFDDVYNPAAAALGQDSAARLSGQVMDSFREQQANCLPVPLRDSIPATRLSYSV